MSGVAFNNNGEPFDTGAAVAWRVRRLRDRGLEVVYVKGGCTPLYLPISISAEEFQREVDNEEAKYRLDPLDEDHQPVEGVSSAYLVIRRREASAGLPASAAVAASADARATAHPANENTGRGSAPMSETGELLRMVVTANAKTTRAIAKRYADVLDAAARVLSADGANVPARQAYEQQQRNAAALFGGTDSELDADDSGDDGDEEDEDPNVWWRVMNLADDYAPVVKKIFGVDGPAATPRNAKVRNGKRKASSGADAAPVAGPQASAPKAETKTEGEAKVPPRKARTSEPEAATVPPMTPEKAMHFMAIKKQLTAEEVAFLKELSKEMTPAEVAEWMDALSKLSVDEAVAKIRAQIEGESEDLDEDEDINQEDDESDESEDDQADDEDEDEEVVS